MKYKLIVDYGKPSEEDFKTKEDLFKKLKIWEQEQEEDKPYSDIFILNESDEDITEPIFEEFFKKWKKEI